MNGRIVRHAITADRRLTLLFDTPPATSICIQGGRLIDPVLGLDTEGDLLVKAGRIAAVGANLTDQAEEIFPARGLVVCPGLVDIHVHLRVPGDEHKETIETGTAAAAAGGFTAVVCEPNTRPVLDSGIMIMQLLQRSRLESHVRIHAKGCLTLAGRGQEIVDIAEMKQYGAVALSSDGDPIESIEVMRQALTACRHEGILPTLHDEESGWVVWQRKSHEREPALVCRDIELAAETHSPLHFQHISTREAVEAIRTAKLAGIAVTAEVTPHHLALCDEDTPADDTNCKVNPPLRTASDRDAVRWALIHGIIDCVATDHAPHTPTEKARSLSSAPFGMIGMETALGVVLTTMHHTGMMDLSQIVAVMSTTPRRILRLPEIQLAEGSPADLTLFDPNADWVVDPERFYSKGRNCPFGGQTLRGQPVATMVAGRWAFKDGLLV